MNLRKTDHRKRKWRILAACFIFLVLILAAFFLWTLDYYHADQEARKALETDEHVTVQENGSGWLFDGPSQDTAFIFYPGAKVEASAYAPLLHEMAESAADIFLVKMPCNLAFLGMNRAEEIMAEFSYQHWYIGGHSLGGAMAAYYASKHKMDGVILFAAYPVKELNTDVLLMYGSEDRVVNRSRIVNAAELVHGSYTEYVIEGGNHAQFGNYGKQKGDGEAFISAGEQQAKAVEQGAAFVKKHE